MSAPLAQQQVPHQPLPEGPGDDLEPLSEAQTAHQAPSPAADVDFTRLYRIRPFEEGDQQACRALYTRGLLGGKLAANDSGIDIDDIRSAYLLDPLSGFWVAELSDAVPDFSQWLEPDARPGDIVGMVGVQHHDEGVGEVRRLRVHPAHRRRRLGSRLLETAIRFCRDSGCLKVQLDTFVQREAAVRLFERFHFHHGRTRSIGGKELLYFYLDLYTQERAEK